MIFFAAVLALSVLVVALAVRDLRVINERHECRCFEPLGEQPTCRACLGRVQ